MESMSWPLTPKSHSLISPLELTRMLDGFTSEGQPAAGEGVWPGPQAPVLPPVPPIHPLTSVHDLVLFPEIRQTPEDLRGGGPRRGEQTQGATCLGQV